MGDTGTPRDRSSSPCASKGALQGFGFWILEVQAVPGFRLWVKRAICAVPEEILLSWFLYVGVPCRVRIWSALNSRGPE